MDNTRFIKVLDQLNQRQIALLRHYVEGLPLPEDADEFDLDLLLRLGLLEIQKEERVN